MTALTLAEQRVGKVKPRPWWPIRMKKLALIREMKAQLMSGEKQPLDADTF